MTPKTNENLAEEDTSMRPRTRSQTRDMPGNNATQEQNNSPTITNYVEGVSDNLTPRETDGDTVSINISEQAVANSPPHIESPAPPTLTEDDVGLSKKTGARLVMVAGSIRSDEYDPNEDEYEGEDGDEVMERTKRDVWEHDKELKTYIGEMYATKFETDNINKKLDQAKETAEENDRQRREENANIQMRFDALIAQMQMDREQREREMERREQQRERDLALREQEINFLKEEIKSVKTTVDTMKEDLTVEFNKTNEEWRLEQMQRIDKKMEETAESMRNGIMEMVAEAVAKDSMDIRTQLQQMAAKKMEEEDEYATTMEEYKKKLANIDEYEKRYGATSKDFSRLRSESDTAKNRLKQLEDEMADFRKAMQTFKDNADKHVKVLGNLNQLSHSVTHRQEMSEITETKLQGMNDRISEFQTETVPAINSALAAAKSIRQDTQRDAKMVETISNRMQEEEKKRTEQANTLKTTMDLLTAEARELQQHVVDSDIQDRLRVIEEELATTKLLLHETQGRPSIKMQKKEDIYELIRDKLRQDIIKHIKDMGPSNNTSNSAPSNPNTTQIDVATVEATVANIIKNYAPSEARVEQIVRHSTLTPEDVTRILQSENEVYDKEMLKLIEDKQDQIFEKMHATEALIKQLEEKCDEMVEDIRKAQEKYEQQSSNREEQETENVNPVQSPRHPPTPWARQNNKAPATPQSAYVSPQRQHETTPRMANYSPGFLSGRYQGQESTQDSNESGQRYQSSEEGSYMRSPEGYFKDGTPYFVDRANGFEEYIPLHHYPKRPELAGMKVPSETECRRMKEQFDQVQHQQQYGPSPNAHQEFSPDRNPHHQSRGTEYRQAGTNRMQRMLIPKHQRTAWYLMGQYGQPQLQQHHFYELGFLHPLEACDVILPIHSTLMSSWESTSYQGGTSFRKTQGPDTRQITSSNAFTRLELSRSKKDQSDEVIEWYNEFAQLAEPYSIPVVPFELIEPEYGAAGTCIPGIGLEKYDKIGRALHLLLSTKILPMNKHADESELSHALSSATSQLKPNGYELLHALLKKMIPAFNDEILDLGWPRYVDYSTIFKYARSMERTVILASKQGRYITPKAASMHFLKNIMSDGGQVYRIQAQMLMTQLNEVETNGPIDPRFDIKRMADEINKANSYQPTDTDLTPPPRISKVRFTSETATNTTEPSIPVQSHTTTTPRGMDDFEGQQDANMQGYSIRRYYANETYRQNKDPRRNYKPRRKPVPDPTKAPRKRHSSYDKTIQCHACGLRGHKATQCYALAAALYVDEYLTKHGKDASTVKAAMQHYMERNAPILTDAVSNERLKQTPMQVLKTYLDRTWNEIEMVRDQMDWLYFDEGGTEEEVFGILGGQTDYDADEYSQDYSQDE